MKTNLDYILERGLKNDPTHYNTPVASAFYKSLNPLDQELIDDIFTYNGHAYYTMHLHTMHKFQYTDPTGSVGFSTKADIENYLKAMSPVERTPYKSPEEAAREEETYIIAYCLFTGDKEAGDDSVSDHYTVFRDDINGDLKEQAEQEFDTMVKSLKNLHSASLCKVIKSTDY